MGDWFLNFFYFLIALGSEWERGHGLICKFWCLHNFIWKFCINSFVNLHIFHLKLIALILLKQERSIIPLTKNFHYFVNLLIGEILSFLKNIFNHGLMVVPCFLRSFTSCVWFAWVFIDKSMWNWFIKNFLTYVQIINWCQ